MKANCYDAIVVGAGGMGSMACWQLAKAGLRTLGIEQFGIGHKLGSSHGETRIIRKAYFEHPDYVPLLQHAYKMWAELERDVGRKLFVRSGLLIAGDPHSSAIIQGIDRSARQFNLDVTSPSHQSSRFSRLSIPPGWELRYEDDAGYLLVEDAVMAAADCARRFGAEIEENARVLSWSHNGKYFDVETTSGIFASEKLVICGGAWTAKILPAENLPITARRVVVHWYQDPKHAYGEDSGMPCFGIDTAAGFVYGFPGRVGGLVKAGLHVPGEILHDPGQVNRTVASDEHELLSHYLQQHLPLLSPKPAQSQTCIYEMTPDEHFIIDQSKDIPGLSFACGFSGHGFKFASAVGHILAEFCTTGSTKMPIHFLSQERFDAAR
jgi:sarcosine oxidase